MFKKIGIAAVALGAAFILLTWAGLGSYASTAFHKLRASLKKQVPLEFEIERLKNEIGQLAPEMKKNLGALAEEMVAIENLKEEITVTKANLKKQKENILTMTKDLETGMTSFVYGNREYTAARVKQKLADDFASYQRTEGELKSKEQLLEAKERGLEAAREQLSTIRSQKQELETQVAQLETDLKAIRLAQSRNKFQIDDSQLARCKATLAEIRNRLKVEKTREELFGSYANDPTIQVEKKVKATGELAREIKAYFEESSPGQVASEKP